MKANRYLLWIILLTVIAKGNEDTVISWFIFGLMVYYGIMYIIEIITEK